MVRRNRLRLSHAPNVHSLVSFAKYGQKTGSSGCALSFGQMENEPGSFIEEFRIHMEIKLTAVFRKIS